MRDSRIGTYGALALGLSLVIRIAALAALARPGAVFAALIAAGAVSRASIVLVLSCSSRRERTVSPPR